MRIAILLAHEANPYEGTVRPFVNWAKELSKNHEIYFILYKSKEELTELIESMNSIQSKNLNTFGEVMNYLKEIGPDVLFSDDYFQRLKLVSKIKDEVKIKTITYVLILFGTHSVMDVFDVGFLPFKEKLLFQLTRFIPFNLLKRQYKKLLGKQDMIIANSKITATLLHVLYGVESDEIVYPPIDTEVFRPYRVEKENQILLYLGSHGGDTDEDFTRKICQILQNKKIGIIVMGNKKLAKRLSKEFEIDLISGVSDRRLAEIYSLCKLVVCPQKWEMFGYVPVESMACGTPVLAFNCMGLSETILDRKTGWLAKNKREFLEKLDSILRNKENQLNRNFIKRYARKNFSAYKSVKKLNEILTVI